MAHAISNREFAHEAAAERLIVKLILNPTLVGPEREAEKARLIDKFHRELNDFSKVDAVALIVHIFGSQRRIQISKPTVGTKIIL
jgi:hypothetical protein